MIKISLRSSKMNDLCLVLLGNYYNTFSNNSFLNFEEKISLRRSKMNDLC